MPAEHCFHSLCFVPLDSSAPRIYAFPQFIAGLDHNGKLARAVKFKVRRLIYDEIVEMNTFPNFKGARLLGLCLNVMGLHEPNRERHRDSRALHKVVLRWTKRHYAWLHSVRPKVAEACLVDGMTYDPAIRRITNTWPAEGLRDKPYQVHLDVEPPATDAPVLSD